MSLKKTELKNGLIDLQKSLKEMDNPDEAMELFASKLSDLIDSFVKSGEVTFEKGDVTGTTAVQGTPTPLALGAASKGKIT